MLKASRSESSVTLSAALDHNEKIQRSSLLSHPVPGDKSGFRLHIAEETVESGAVSQRPDQCHGFLHDKGIAGTVALLQKQGSGFPEGYFFDPVFHPAIEKADGTQGNDTIPVQPLLA